MQTLRLTAALTLILGGSTGSASADPDKDESGKGRWRGGYARSYDDPGRGYGYRYERPRRERRAFTQEWDDGDCKYERKLEESGEYKEEVKCRGGRRSIRPMATALNSTRERENDPGFA